LCYIHGPFHFRDLDIIIIVAEGYML
jgi:hypothetical protein